MPANPLYTLFKSSGLASVCSRYSLTKNQAWGRVYRARQRELKEAGGVDPFVVQKLRGAAFSLAKKTGYGYLAPDFASYCVVRLYQGQLSSLRNLFTDFKRLTLGECRRRGSRAKNLGEKTLVLSEGSGIDSEGGSNYEGGSLEDVVSVVPVALPDPNVKVFELLDGLKFPSSSHRAMFVMYTVFNLKEEEIALAFGVHASRVSQKLREVKRNLETKRENEK